MVAGIYLFALTLRSLNVLQIQSNDPYFFQPSVDPLFYHEWAIRIAQGDLLGDGVFLQGPLYPYLLGGVYWLTGPNLLVPRLLQSLLGAAVCVLVWQLARQLFDRRVALLAAAMASVHAMAIFYEGSLLIVNVLTPIILMLLIEMARAEAQPTPLRWGGVGLLAGLAALARPNMLLFIPFILVWMAWGMWGRVARERIAVMLACFAIGTALMLGPSLLHNVAVAGDWVLVSASAGMNFYNGNGPDANGVHNVPRIFDRSQADHPAEQNLVYAQVAEAELGRPLLASEVSDYWFARGLAHVREHPGEWLRLLFKKSLLFVNAGEPWNNRSIDVSRQFSWVLRLPLLTFGVIAPFALLGVALGLPHWRTLLPLYGLLGVYAATCIAFFMLSRYREPAVPVFVIFASYAIVWLFDVAKQRRTKALIVGCSSLALLALVVHREIIPVDLSVAYYNLGNKYLGLNDHDRAVAQYDRSLAIDASYISAHNNRALAIEASGRSIEEKIAAWRVVRALGAKRGLASYVERADRHIRDLERNRIVTD